MTLSKPCAEEASLRAAPLPPLLIAWLCLGIIIAPLGGIALVAVYSVSLPMLYLFIAVMTLVTAVPARLYLNSHIRKEADKKSRTVLPPQLSPAPVVALPEEVHRELEIARSHLHEALRTAQSNGDARLSYEAQAALQEHLPETLQAWSVLPEAERVPEELVEQLRVIREIVPLPLGYQNRWETQKRFLRSKRRPQ